jgi:hypothetical protein
MACRRVAGGAAIAALVFAAGTTAALSSPVQTSTWRIVKSQSSSGQHPALTISATINHPRGIGVRLSSPTHVGGTIYWSCRKGFQGEHGQIGVLGGFHALPHVRGEDSCGVFIAARVRSDYRDDLEERLAARTR